MGCNEYCTNRQTKNTATHPAFSKVAACNGGAEVGNIWGLLAGGVFDDICDGDVVGSN